MLTPVRERETNTALHSEPEPTWEIAHLFPLQGAWGEDEYMELRPNRHVEFTDGVLEVLPMPKQSHQFLVLHLFESLEAFVKARNLGTVMLAPLRVRLWARTYREPDVVFMGAEHDERRGEDFWEGADLVMEV
ncbi:MAG: Uma2 family endonuclease, partial [Chloroflexi bacterium]|nr:Uma2 family endonuclease [Chloroflexota bacterium]